MTTKPYRPEGLEEWYENTHDKVESLGILPPQVEYPIVVSSDFEWGTIRRQIFEAGADAMLEGLKKEAWNKLKPGDYMETNAVSGYLVCIPED